MSYLKTRSLFVACSATLVLLAAPSESKALFEWLCPANWFNPAPAAQTYAPPYSASRVVWQPVAPAASACNPCAPQGASYVPQTNYRWSYSRIERTTYRPLTTWDACTGCPRTVYQPVTNKTLLPWLHRKSYTTYRPVYSSPYTSAYTSYASPWSSNACNPCGAGACDPCGGSAWGSAASSCPSGSCAPISYSATAPSYNGGQPIDSGTASPPSTYKQEAETPDVRLKPTPDSSTGPAPTGPPTLILPDTRTTLQPIRQAALYQPISLSSSATRPASRPAKPPLDVSGWRASHD